VASDNLAALTAYTVDMRKALAAQGITGDKGAEIDQIELFGPDDQGADSRNFVLCPGDAYDRSPCGIGTCAKVACLAAEGLLAPGAVWQQASVIGSRFAVSYETVDGQIIPTVRGRAYVSAESRLVLDPQDPFCWGIRL
jgi:4-hydroxyproline epimerase